MNEGREAEISLAVQNGMNELRERISSGVNRYGFIPKPREKKISSGGMKFYNVVTGETREINPLAMRLGRQRRRVLGFCNVIKNKDVDMLMVRLSYVNETYYGDRDITNYIRKVKTRYGVNVLAYTWVAEMQERKVLHYHVIFVVPKGFRMLKPDCDGTWDKGSTRIEKARTVWYVASYTGKESQKADLYLIPYVHMFAIWISEKVANGFDRWEMRKTNFPGWVLDIVNSRGDWIIHGVSVERSPGGGWWIDNMLFESPWVVTF